MDRSVTCIISGTKYTLSDSYYKKKIEEYGSVEALKQYFATKKVIRLIQRGYGVEEIRNILSVDGDDLPSGTCFDVKKVIEYHSVRKGTSTKKSTNFATHKSDEDVIEFINNIKSNSL